MRSGDPRQGIERTLFVEARGIEDLLAALPALHALGRTYPRARHEVLTTPAGAELLATDPFVDCLHTAAPEESSAALERLLAGERYDLVVREELQGSPLLEAVVDEHARGDGRLYLTAAERAAGRRVRAGDAPLVALLVGGAGRREDLFAALARGLRRRGAEIVAVPGAPEAEARAMAAAVGPAARLWPRGPLRELAARLAQVDLAVASDSALGRLASAVGAPTIDVSAAASGDALDVEREAERRLDERGKWGQTRIFAAARARAPHATATVSKESARPEARSPFRGLRLRALGRRPRDEDWLRARRVLVVRADNIGDVVMTGPALRALKRSLPGASLTLLASPAGAMAAPLLPWVDDTIAWRVLWQELHGRRADPASERRLIATLQARRFDAAIVLTSFSQNPHAAACVAWFAGIPLRAGASRERGSLLTHALPKGDLARHQVDRNLDLVRTLGFPCDDDALEVRVPDGARCGAAALLAARGVPPGQPYLLVNPWASIEARTYDGGRLARAAKLVSAAAGLPIIVTGHQRDAARTALLAERMGPAAVDLCGDTSVTELAALVARARLVLTNNTSVMHLAEALGTPAVVVYSGTDLESQWTPRRSPHRLLRKPTSCSPCYAFTCPLDRACLDIEPADVADAAIELLGETERHA
ncbi:MAG TPA: glycosyltransferase family 9 protein [Gammaproteobacteria bacterium]|nr:glycosyltransferase family 9 protein [Gammaproteobacteria bacterium]